AEQPRRRATAPAGACAGHGSPGPLSGFGGGGVVCTPEGPLPRQGGLMLARLRAHLNYSNVLATAAVFAALGGTGFAAATIGTAQLKNGAVTNPKLASNAVTSAKVKDGSLLIKDFKANVLRGTVVGPQGPTGPTG